MGGRGAVAISWHVRRNAIKLEIITVRVWLFTRLQAISLMDKSTLPNDSLEEFLSQLDPRMVAIGFACASLTPGVAGQAGAVAAIAFDAKHKQWYGVALSAASIVPLAGYVPGVFKVGWLLRLLDRDLMKLEDQLPVLHQSPDAIASLRKTFDKYYRKLPDIKITRSFRKRLAHIMALDEPAPLALTAESEGGPISNPINNL